MATDLEAVLARVQRRKLRSPGLEYAHPTLTRRRYVMIDEIYVFITGYLLETQITDYQQLPTSAHFERFNHCPALNLAFNPPSRWYLPSNSLCFNCSHSPSNMKIAGRTFIVSGGSSGLGLATVQDLIAADAYISIVDRAPPPQALPTSQIRYFETDITNLKQIQQAVDGTVEWAAATNAPLGGVINCAGVGTAAKIIDAHNEPHSLDLWDFTLAVNVTGTFNLTRLALQHMIKATPEDGPDGERGVIVMVSSAAAFEGQPGQTAYAASKGALLSMTLPLARDLSRHAIRVVTIAPGVFDSNMTANFPEKTRRSLSNEGVVYPRRFGQPHEFAQTIRWILSTPYMNGEVIRLSGGGRLPGKL